MNVQVRETQAAQTLSVVDCDIHPALRTPKDLHPYLSARWREHMDTFGAHMRHGLSAQLPFPRMVAGGMRVDSFPEEGPPGCDLKLTQTQHLDANGIETGLLISLSKGGLEERNLDFAAALARAVNDWQIAEWVEPEPRLRAGIIVPQEDSVFAVSEIERRASDPRFVQILISPRSGDPLGHRRYWPIYAAAQAADRPIGLHVQGFSGGHASTSSGWGTYYMEEHYAMSTIMQATVASLIFEGVFEQFPKLKVILIEGGFAWAPALGWRMDKQWKRLRAETPHVKRPPSEYMREHMWFTTQPIEEPDDPQHIADIMGWIGWERLLFSTDYPHWDFDHPAQTFKFKLGDAQKAMLFHDNAKAVYRL